MLDRLESARREAARTALAAQEAERLRVARELRVEIGQTLTAVTIEAERAADGGPALASAAQRRVAEASATVWTRCGGSPASCGSRRSTTSASVNVLIALCNRVAALDGPVVRRDLQCLKVARRNVLAVRLALDEGPEVGPAGVAEGFYQRVGDPGALGRGAQLGRAQAQLGAGGRVDALRESSSSRRLRPQRVRMRTARLGRVRAGTGRNFGTGKTPLGMTASFGSGVPR
jgi:hypothetical protein